MFSGGGGKVPLIWLAGGKTRRYKNHYGGFPQFLILYLRVLPPANNGITGKMRKSGWSQADKNSRQHQINVMEINRYK